MLQHIMNTTHNTSYITTQYKLARNSFKVRVKVSESENSNIARAVVRFEKSGARAPTYTYLRLYAALIN